VGNEFSSVEALWSQFENVMAKDPEAAGADGREEAEDDDTTVQHEDKA
jgi:DASH complex subunit DAD1